MHDIVSRRFIDSIGEGQKISFVHSNKNASIQMRQTVSVYKGQHYFLVSLDAWSKTGGDMEVNYISPITVYSANGASCFVKGENPRILDVPFDNDNWTKVLTAEWIPGKLQQGTGYNFTSLYDLNNLSGLVIGAVTHDFWKTGIHYTLSGKKGVVDSLAVFGGAATSDDKSLPAEYGGNDGTHDMVSHGAMKGKSVYSPKIFVCGSENRNDAFKAYGIVNRKLNGYLDWKDSAPFYWNSFGVEGVLGYEGRMMPEGVLKISDELASLRNFSHNKKVYLSIDSYDQGIYNKEVLKSIQEHCVKNNQELGFYFIPFAVWTWKSSVEKDKLQYTDSFIRDVTLKDNNGKTIVYKDGEFGAFPLDPTHPATRERIIGELQKAKAIGAKFLKIDFLTAGALESSIRFDKKIQSGLQGYNFGMKMLKGLIDSVLGPDVFITQAISPTFPNQYAHTRFLSTDVYSHLRNDQKGFPHYGSTASSMISSSHLGWMQGTLWPFTNMDISVMKNFQKNNDISEQDVKVRLITMIIMGSVLGDGSDFRNRVAKERALHFLNNKYLSEYFNNPKAFIPLKVADGLDEDQQLAFYLPGDTVYASLVNFSNDGSFHYRFQKDKLQLYDEAYNIYDFFSNKK
ncbi:alpha-amylase family protein [Niabella ginsengisoli]|uniref:Alpha-galactosidase n=1 Tax=Niabella ginsengisoli TaxID=522298 RepID=A0ABS9SLF8_9BACT|nr:hypothetical protein [Niabella ginsengisoli]MCH5599121.1 hypothetical protein [Niabella ginsengisoli]